MYEQAKRILDAYHTGDSVYSLDRALLDLGYFRVELTTGLYQYKEPSGALDFQVECDLEGKITDLKIFKPIEE